MRENPIAGISGRVTPGSVGQILLYFGQPHIAEDWRRFVEQSGLVSWWVDPERWDAAYLQLPEHSDPHVTFEALLKNFDHWSGEKYNISIDASRPSMVVARVSTTAEWFRRLPRDEGTEDDDDAPYRRRGTRRRGSPETSDPYSPRPHRWGFAPPPKYAKVAKRVRDHVAETMQRLGMKGIAKVLESIGVRAGWARAERRMGHTVVSGRDDGTIGIEINLRHVDGDLKPADYTSDAVFEAVLGHEYAHAIDNILNGHTTAHGPTWKDVMRALGVRRPHAKFDSGWIPIGRPRRNPDEVDTGEPDGEAWFTDNPSEVDTGEPDEEAWFS